MSTQTIQSQLTQPTDCKKLGVNTYHYLLDRVSKKFQLPSLAIQILIAGRSN